MSRVPLRKRVLLVGRTRQAAQDSLQLYRPLSDSISSPSPTPHHLSPSEFPEQHHEHSIWGPRPRRPGIFLEKGAFSSAVLEPFSGVGSLSRKTSALGLESDRVGRLHKG